MPDCTAKPVVIRCAEPTDCAAIAACARAAYRPYVARIGREPAPMVADFGTAIEKGHVVVGEAPDTGAVLGYAIFYPDGDHIHLENVAVQPHFKGQGIGGQLIRYVETVAQKQGFAAVELYTHEKMVENQAMYPKLGYAETGRRTEQGFARVFYRKALPTTA